MKETDFTLRPAIKRGRVLVAEDNAEMRWLLIRGLERAGFEVIDADCGTDAIELLADSLIAEPDEQYDVIVSDILLPGCNGVQVLAAARHSGVRIPVILITAYGTPDTHARAHRLGAFAIFDKPLDVDDVVTAALAATAQFA
jgi:DNA-binding NtrC family response regulator